MQPAAGTPTACPDCGAVAAGRYCGQCGQRLGGRLTLGRLGGEFAARFFSAESGLWHTVVGLLLRPGRTARAYLDGRRRSLIGPLGFFAICAGAQMLSLWTLREHVTGAIVDQLPSAYFDQLRDLGITEPRQWASDRYLRFVQNAYSWLGLFTFALPMATLTWLARGFRVHFAETLAVSLYTIGLPMLVTAFSGQATLRLLPPTAHSISSLLLYLGHATATFGGCFGWRWRSMTATVVGILLAMTCFGFSIYKLTLLAFDPRF